MGPWLHPVRLVHRHGLLRPGVPLGLYDVSGVRLDQRTLAYALAVQSTLLQSRSGEVEDRGGGAMRTSVSTGAAAEDNLGLNRGWLGGWMGKGIRLRLRHACCVFFTITLMTARRFRC